VNWNGGPCQFHFCARFHDESIVIPADFFELIVTGAVKRWHEQRNLPVPRTTKLNSRFSS
jgi:hypothetical protein